MGGAPARSAAAPPPPAFSDLYAAHFDVVWNVLRRLGVWERDLEDAAHDVFIVVHRRLGDYDTTRPVRPWLCGIAARVASEFRRRSQHRHEIVNDEMDRDAAHPMPHALDVAQTTERRRLVLQGLDRLSDDRRAVLVLHDIEGHAMPDISLALDVNVNTLYARLRAARQDFEAAVRALAPGGMP